MFIASVMPSSHLIRWHPLLLLPSIFPTSGTFQWVVCSHQMTKILELQLQHQSFQWIFRVNLPEDWLVWSPCCPRDFQESSPAPQFEGINSLVFCLLYSPTLKTMCDHWKDLQTWGTHLLVSYLFGLLYSSWDSHSKYTGVVCHSFLQWIMFCQNSPQWPVSLRWPHMAWLTTSFRCVSPFATTRQWGMKGVKA